MNNGQNLARARHLEDVANGAKRYILAEILDVTNAVASELENLIGGTSYADFTGATSIAGGLSGLVPAPSIGDENKFLRGDGSWATIQSGSASSASSGNVLDTVASTVDGGLWYELVDNAPVLKLRSGNYEYAFNYDTREFVGTVQQGLAMHLPFESSIAQDICGNTWTVGGNASLDSSVKKFGNTSAHFPSDAYISATNILELNAEKWTFDAWIRVDTANERAVQLGGSAQSIAGIVFAHSRVYIANDAGTGWQQQLELVQVGWQSLYSWFHAAIVKDGSSLTFFVNGTKTHTCTLSSQIFNTGAVALGGNSEWARCDVYFQHVRFFEGVALWTDDFTPPTASDYD